MARTVKVIATPGGVTLVVDGAEILLASPGLGEHATALISRLEMARAAFIAGGSASFEIREVG